MIITTTSFELLREDGTKLYIEIDPVPFEEDGQTNYRGVYQLQATRHNDPAGEYTEDNPGDTTAIGEFAHKSDDLHEWLYLGDFLTDDEQAQVASHIQNYEDDSTMPKRT